MTHQGILECIKSVLCNCNTNQEGNIDMTVWVSHIPTIRTVEMI